MTALGMWTSVSPFAADHIGSLWYGTLERYRMMLIPLYGVLAVAGWTALGHALAWLARRASGGTNSRRVVSVLPGLAVVVVIGVAVASWAPVSMTPLRSVLVRRSPQGPEFTRVMQWLADRTRPGQSLAVDHNIDLLSWAHGDYGVPSLFGLSPRTGPGVADWAARYHVLQWLAATPGERPRGCDTRRYGVRYLASGPPILTSSIFDVSIDHAALGRSPNLRLVHSDGPMRVYEVTAAGRACIGGSAPG